MKKYQLPTLEDKMNIHNTIHHRSKGLCNHIDMMRIVGNTIKKYGVTKIPVFDYNVKILQNTKVKINGEFVDIPVISIEGTQMSDQCPVCKRETETGYLLTQEENFDKDYDIVVVNCLECGCMYSTKGDNHRKYALAAKEC